MPRVPVSLASRKVQGGVTTGPLVLYDQYARRGAPTSIDGYVGDVSKYVRALSSDTTRPAKLYNLANAHLLDTSDPRLLTHWLRKGPNDHLPFVPESASVP